MARLVSTIAKDTNPKDAIGTAKWRQFMTVPRQVMWEVGVAMLEGALKYGRHNYRASGVRASVYLDAAYGHLDQFTEGEDIDRDSGLSHVTKAIASLTVLRDAMMNDFWVDDRPPKIADLDDVRDRLQDIVAENFQRYSDKDPHHYTQIEDGAPYRENDPSGLAMDLETRTETDFRGFSPREEQAMMAHGDDVFQVNLGSVAQEDEALIGRVLDEVNQPEDSSFHAIFESLPDGYVVEGLLSRDIQAYAAHLEDPTYMPYDVLGDDDPTQIIRVAEDAPNYDRSHIVEGLTQKQLDNLTAHEAATMAAIGNTRICRIGHAAFMDHHAHSIDKVSDMVVRRVLIRLKAQPLRQVRLDFPMGGSSERSTRLTNKQWFVAVPGVRVTEMHGARLFKPDSFA